MNRILALSVILTLGACAQVPLADPRADQEAKSFSPPERDKGALYIYRSGYMGVARPIDVAIAGGANAQLASNTYLRLEGPPGPVSVECRVGDKTGGNQVEIMPGRTRFLEVSMKIGVMMPGCEVAEVSPDQGRAAVQGSKRVLPQ